MTELHPSLIRQIEGYVDTALAKHAPNDLVAYTVSFVPLPTDTTWEPTIVLFLLAPPVGKVDGFHYGEYFSAYSVTPELVDHAVSTWTTSRTDRFAELRAARTSTEIEPALPVEEPVV